MFDSLGIHFVLISTSLGSAELEALMSSLNIGTDGDHDHGHVHGHSHIHEEGGHGGHDHGGQRLVKRSSHERHEGHESNTTWEEVCNDTKYTQENP